MAAAMSYTIASSYAETPSTKARPEALTPYWAAIPGKAVKLTATSSGGGFSAARKDKTPVEDASYTHPRSYDVNPTNFRTRSPSANK